MKRLSVKRINRCYGAELRAGGQRESIFPRVISSPLAFFPFLPQRVLLASSGTQTDSSWLELAIVLGIVFAALGYAIYYVVKGSTGKSSTSCDVGCACCPFSKMRPGMENSTVLEKLKALRHEELTKEANSEENYILKKRFPEHCKADVSKKEEKTESSEDERA